MNDARGRLAKLLAVTVGFCISVASTAAAPPPRAWLIEKGGASAVIVGESHLATPAEFDTYFSDVIRPAFNSARTVVSETVQGPEQRKDFGLNVGTPCPGSAERVDVGRAAVYRALIRSVNENDPSQPIPVWMEQWSVFPEYVQISALQLGFEQDEASRAIAAGHASKSFPGVSLVLQENPVSRGGKKFLGLDTPLDFKRHFCSATAADRNDFVLDRTEALTNTLHRLFHPEDADYAALLDAMGVSVNTIARCVDNKPACGLAPPDDALVKIGWSSSWRPGNVNILIQQRNLTWLPRIRSAIDANDKAFIIVGMLHLADLQVGERSFKGLVTLLREQGYTVRPILNGAGLIP